MQKISCPLNYYYLFYSQIRGISKELALSKYKNLNNHQSNFNLFLGFYVYVGLVNDHPCYIWTRKFKSRDKSKENPLVMMHGMGAGQIIILMNHNLTPFCIPESFNTNISHQLFDYKITFVNSQH